METPAAAHEGFQLVSKSRKRRCHDEQDPRNIIEGKRKRVESKKLALSHGNQSASGVRKATTAALTSSPSIQSSNYFDVLSADDKSSSDNEVFCPSEEQSSADEESDASVVEVEVCILTLLLVYIRNNTDLIHKAST